METPRPVDLPRPPLRSRGDGAAEACLNCGAEMAGPYCAQCGQERVDPDAPLGALVHDALGDAFAWDSRAFRTLRWLLRRPGHLSREWAAGRRARYVPPFRLYVWLTLVLVGSNALYRGTVDWLHVHPDHDGDAVEEATDGREYREGPFGDALVGSKMDRMNRWSETLMDVWMSNFFATTPVIGFGFYVFFRERRPRYAPHFALGLELAALGIVLLIAMRWVRLAVVLVPPHVPLSEAAPWSKGVVFAALLVGTLVLSTRAVRRFYELPWWKAVAASPLLLAAPYAALTVLMMVVWVLALTLPL